MFDHITANPVPGRSIGEHGIVGNLDTAALVASDGTIDFLPWPHLDSPTVFAALLDPAKGGSFAMAPLLPGARTAQLYLPDTNVLVTRWLSDVKRRTGLSTTEIYRKEATGDFPSGRKIGARAIAWYASEVTAWIKTRPQCVPLVGKS